MFLLAESPSPSDTVSNNYWVVSEIRIAGNKHTLRSVILAELGFSIGDSVCTATLDLGKIKLEKTALFRDVAVAHWADSGFVMVMIIVEEGLNLRLTATPRRYTKKMGMEEQWYSLSAKALLYNFRGKRQIFWVQAEGWDRKGAGIGWQQPYRSSLSPYYYWSEISGSFWPHEHEPYEAKTILAEVGGGRKVLGPLHMFTRLSYHNIRTDSIGLKVTDFYFSRGGTGFLFDNRDEACHSRKGHYFSIGLDQYGLVRQNNVHYLQGSGLWKGYFPLFWETHYLAGMGMFTKRFQTPPYFARIYGGGDGSIRGYESGSLRGDNRMTLNAEYRVEIFKTPVIPVPYLDYFMPALGRLYGLVELAVFTDAGIYWDTGMSPADIPSARSYGFGIRGWIPPTGDSAAMDFAWNRYGEFFWYLSWQLEF